MLDRTIIALMLVSSVLIAVTWYIKPFPISTIHLKSSSNYPDVERTLESASGVYYDRKHTNDIVVLNANYGYLDFLINWVCMSNRLNIKFVVLSLDDELHHHLNNNTNIPSISGRAFNISSPPGFSNFASRDFTIINYQKFVTIHSILATGHNVLYSDADTVLLEDPIRHLRKDVDFEFQSDSDHPEFLVDDTPCAGFFYVRSTANARNLLRKTMDLVVDSNFTRMEQYVMKDILKEMRMSGDALYIPHNNLPPKTDKLTYRQLPSLSFVNGGIFFADNYEDRRKTAGVRTVMVHANFFVGSDQKRNKLRERGLWRTVKQEQSCEGEVNCYGRFGNEWLRCAEDGE
jgi:Nucleotide-diphospho-sugar transferase